MDERLVSCQRVWAQVDLDAIEENMRSMKEGLDGATGMLAVVKADGYGHGSVPVARRLEPLPFLAGFAVATAEEAHELRQGGIGKPVLVLGYTFPYSYEMMVREEIRPAVFRPDAIEELGRVLDPLRRLGHARAIVRAHSRR